MNEAKQPPSTGGRWAPRLLVAMVAVGAVYVAWLALSYRYHFLDGVNLLIHEAGHVIFSPFGVILGVLGGTLLQLVFPIVFVVYFARRDQPMEAAVCTVWSAESLMYTAEYLGDANAQVLPLIGGHIHDWHFLLERAGLLSVAEETAVGLHFLASVVAVLAIFSMFRRVLRR